SSLKPQVHYTGRLASDPAGQMGQGEGRIVNGAGAETGNLSCWGDYRSMSVDAVDGCTFWYADEYLPASGSFSWRARIGTFKLPGCGVSNDFSISASPSSVSATQNGTATSTIATAVTSGSAQTVSLSASGLPSGATASFSPASVTAGGSSTLTLGAGSAPPGTYTLTITGPAPSATNIPPVILTVTAAPPSDDFSISASPTSLSLVQGQSGISTISTVVTSGSAQTVSLSTTGVPSGATASLNPTAVTAGASSTLTLGAGSATPGTYTITVTGAGTSATHPTTVPLTITAPPPPNDFSISANPTSLSLVQGQSGTSTISTALTSGSAETTNLTVSGTPSGASAGLSPTSVMTGGSSTLTVAAGTAAPGTYPLTITGTATSATHT